MGPEHVSVYQPAWRTAGSTRDRAVAAERSPWRSVAIPSEHGGWGLTLEPVLLGLLVAFSWPGLAIGVAAFLAFLVRTPLKLALVDRRRDRSLPRTRLATRIASAELILLVALAAFAVAAEGTRWLIPVLVALPLVAVQLWFDSRSRSRRLIAELSGAIGISAVSTAIVIAGDGGDRLAIAVWTILAARSFASVPFVRCQIARVRRGLARIAKNDAFQLTGAILAAVGVVIDERVALGAAVVIIAALAQAIAPRRSFIPAIKVIGFRQMGLGLAVVAATAIGAAIL